MIINNLSSYSDSIHSYYFLSRFVEGLHPGQGWGAWLLNQAVASFAEASVRGQVRAMAQDHSFACLPAFLVSAHDVVHGELAAGTISGGALSGVARGTSWMGRQRCTRARPRTGDMVLEVCVASKADLVADEQFMAVCLAETPSAHATA